MYHFIGRNVSVTQNNKTRITVEINRTKYTIMGNESKGQVEKVARLVNDKMEEIRNANKHLDTSRLAVLTAINTMNDYIKLKEEYDMLLSLIEEDK